MNFIKLAEQIAREAHEGQTRWDKNIPYITHPQAVAKAIQNKLWERENQNCCIATAWLHDVIEDCNITAMDLFNSDIPDIIVDAVLVLTKRKNESYLDYILRVKKNGIAKIVKIEDIKHNMLSIPKDEDVLGGKTSKSHKTRRQMYELAIYLLRN